MQDFGTPLKPGTTYEWALEEIERTHHEDGGYSDEIVDVSLFDSLTNLLGDIEYPYTTKMYAIAMRERRPGQSIRYYYIDRRGRYLRLPTWNCETEITAHGAYLMDSSIAANWQNLQLLLQSDTLVCDDASAAPLISEEG